MRANGWIHSPLLPAARRGHEYRGGGANCLLNAASRPRVAASEPSSLEACLLQFVRMPAMQKSDTDRNG